MIYPGQFQKIAGAVTVFTAGAAPKTLSGVAVVANQVRPGTLSALVAVNAKTNTLTITGKWQVSEDNSTWVDVSPVNNAANVLIVTGTGSNVAATRAFEAPNGIAAYPFARFTCVTGTGSADGTDDAAGISYRYLRDE